MLVTLTTDDHIIANLSAARSAASYSKTLTMTKCFTRTLRSCESTMLFILALWVESQTSESERNLPIHA